MADDAIATESLGRCFGDFVAVENVNLRIQKGEVFGLLGPNGAGKTTMVRMLTGVIHPTSGRAWVAGMDVARNPDRVRAMVGILTEVPGLYVRLNAVENLRFFAELHEIEDADTRIFEVLSRLDLWERRSDPVGSWSKGMRQRLAIARAILHRPRVVFLDEPTSALDPRAARNVRELVSELRAVGTTIVLCTHNLDEAERLCDRIALFRKRVVRLGTSDELRLGNDERDTNRVAVRLQTTWDALDAIRALPFVRGAEFEAPWLRVEVSRDAHAVPCLVRELVAGGGDIHALRESSKTLEQVYLELLADSNRGEAADEK